MHHARRSAVCALGVLLAVSGAAAWGDEYRLSLDPIEAAARSRMRPVAMMASAQTQPAGDAAGAGAAGGAGAPGAGAAAGNPTPAQALPPVTVPGENTMAPGLLRYLPDTRELEQAPYRRTLFTGLVKDKSLYGKAWFPEPLSNPGMDLEYSDGGFSWFTQQKKNHYKNVARVSYEHSINALTLEIEVPYQWETETDGGETTTNNGLSNIEVGGRYPLFQIVSDDGVFDYTCVAAGEGAIPTLHEFSQDTELSPRVYQLIRVGDHFSVQTNLGAEFLIGPDRGGTVNLIFGGVFGYMIYHDELPIPYVNTIIPTFEITGEHVLTGEKEGSFSTSIFGTAGIWVNLKSMGPVQPKIGVGWVFPMNDGGFEEMRYGIMSKVILEF